MKKEELETEYSEDENLDKEINYFLDNIWKDDIEIKPRSNLHICSGCNKKFKNVRTLKSHKSNDCGKTYICEKCRKKFVYRSSFCRHRKRCRVMKSKKK